MSANADRSSRRYRRVIKMRSRGAPAGQTRQTRREMAARHRPSGKMYTGGLTIGAPTSSVISACAVRRMSRGFPAYALPSTKRVHDAFQAGDLARTQRLAPDVEKVAERVGAIVGRLDMNDARRVMRVQPIEPAPVADESVLHAEGPDDADAIGNAASCPFEKSARCACTWTRSISRRRSLDAVDGLAVAAPHRVARVEHRLTQLCALDDRRERALRTQDHGHAAERGEEQAQHDPSAGIHATDPALSRGRRQERNLAGGNFPRCHAEGERQRGFSSRAWKTCFRAEKKPRTRAPHRKSRERPGVVRSVSRGTQSASAMTWTTPCLDSTFPVTPSQVAVFATTACA